MYTATFRGLLELGLASSLCRWLPYLLHVGPGQFFLEFTSPFLLYVTGKLSCREGERNHQHGECLILRLYLQCFDQSYTDLCAIAETFAETFSRYDRASIFLVSQLELYIKNN